MIIKLAGCFLLFCMGWLPQNSWALCVGCTCNLQSVTGINFGNYHPFSSGNIDVTGTFTVRCTGLLGLAASFDIKLSTGSSGSYSPRTMKSGSNSLDYNLFTNSARTTVWGDGTGGSSFITRNFILALIGFSSNETVYARLPTGQTTAAVGSYSDTITITVEY